MIGRRKLVALAALALASCQAGGSRDQIKIVGSSTVYPFTTAVAEAFVNQNSNAKAPVVESTGSGAGFKLFCGGVGSEFADISDASRRIKKSEFAQCEANGVKGILEVQIGMDGIAIAEANNGPHFQLTKQDLYRALAASPMGKANTARTWKDVNPALPAIPIQVYGPPSTSGTRDAFSELILARGCEEAYPEAKKLKAGPDESVFAAACTKIRDDGPYIDSGENDNLIVQKLSSNPNAIGIFGYSYLEENKDRIHGIPIEGVEPTYNTIVTGAYPGSRPLYIYVKKQHLNAVPGLKQFLTQYESMWDPKGPLTARGLIAASPEVRQQSARIIDQGIALDPAGLH